MENSVSAAVIEALDRVCSQDASVLKPAEAQLKQWEAHPGFYNVLTVSDFIYQVDLLGYYAHNLLCILYFYVDFMLEIQ